MRQIRTQMRPTRQLGGRTLLVPMNTPHSNIAVVTCYFNPHKSKTRLRCYSRFAQQFQHIGLPLFCAEGSYDGTWVIPNAKRYTLDSGSQMFAKENLLNLLIKTLPDKYEYVVWSDADLLLPLDYLSRLRDAFKNNDVIQGFKLVAHLDAQDNQEGGWKKSCAYFNENNAAPKTTAQFSWPGFIWGAAREYLHNVGGLYDKLITGGSDVAWAAAVYGDTTVIRYHPWASASKINVLEYVANLRAMPPRIGYADASIQHIYHGTLANRKYSERNRMLATNSFDPVEHLEYSASGLLRWSVKAPHTLKQAVRDYMHSRKEDE